MSVIRGSICLCIFLLTSLNGKGQAIAPIPFRKATLILQATPVFIRNAESEANRNGPFTYRNNRIPEPLYVVNGKIIASEDLSKINPQGIDNIIVLKGKDATDRFGSNGANGAIMFNMKKWYRLHHKKSPLK